MCLWTDPADCLNSSGLKLSARFRGLNWFLELWRQTRARCRTTLSRVRPYWAGQVGELATPLSTWAQSSRSRTSADGEQTCTQREPPTRRGNQPLDRKLRSHLEQPESCRPAARKGGRDRADPAGTGPPRHTGTTPPAAPSLKTNTTLVFYLVWVTEEKHA